MLTTTVPTTRPRSGFAEVYARHRDDVFRLALLLCGDRELAEDVTADAFARTWPQWEQGEVADVGAYLRRATVNNVNSFWRRRALRRTREEHRLTGDHRGQRGHDQQLADRDAVMDAVRQLPTKQRTVVVLRFYEDLSTSAIAELTGTSESTVRSNLSRAADTLEDLLGPTTQGGSR